MADIPTQEPQEVKSPVTPSSENQISGEGSVATENQSPAPVQATPEASEWSRLKGSTQDRIRELLEQREYLKTQVEELSKNYKPPVAPTQPAYQQEAGGQQGEITPEQKQAIEGLRKFGIVTKEDISDLQDQIVLEQEYTRLENKFSGADGRPYFDRTEIEDHMRKTGIYNPEKAYEDLYREELFDWKQEQMGATRSYAQPAYSTKPTGSTASRTEPLTVESLRERLAKPDGKDWWNKNRERILPQLGQLLAQ